MLKTFLKSIKINLNCRLFYKCFPNLSFNFRSSTLTETVLSELPEFENQQDPNDLANELKALLRTNLNNEKNDMQENQQISLSADDGGGNKNEHQSIDNQILNIRKQLQSSYGALCTARDRLSKISFQGIENKLKKDNVLLSDSEIQSIVINNSMTDDASSMDNVMLKNLKQKLITIPCQVEPISELQIFYRAIDVLKENLTAICKHEKDVCQLETDVHESLNENCESTKKIQQTLRDNYTLEDIQAAERLVDMESTIKLVEEKLDSHFF